MRRNSGKQMKFEFKRTKKINTKKINTSHRKTNLAQENNRQTTPFADLLFFFFDFSLSFFFKQFSFFSFSSDCGLVVGCRLLVLGCHRILQKKKVNNTEQQENPKRLSARVPPPPNRAKAHQGKAKPSKKHLKPAPKPKWGGKSETEARKT